MARRRDYKQEYKRRLARGRARGMSPAQSRGHPRKGEPPLSAPDALPKSDQQIETAIKLMREGASMTNAAKWVRMSPKRLSQFINAHRLAKFKGRKWSWSDRRIRRMPFLKRERQQVVFVEGFDPASRIGQYFNAMHRALDTNDPIHLESFIDEAITDIHGNQHVFETDLGTIYRFADRDEPAFHEIYKIVAV